MSEDNIVNFTPVQKPKAPEGVIEVEANSLRLVCTRCGCVTFTVDGEDRLECSGCEAEVGNPSVPPGQFEWRYQLPDLPQPGVPLKTTEDMTKDIRTSPYLARARVLKFANEHHKKDTIVILACYSKDDGSKFWMDFNNEDERAWVLRKLEEMATYVVNYKLE